ncbi:alpha-amylase family glycosyl hydrolase [Consotaella aegiceratis]|uniref:alpha-amylase family glycosyl hydrolase n=1 Tax=Consotaella aegiceratis TaxID=3097961 RepID=UPI002F3F68B9
MPDWIKHAVWWHLYPLGFLGAEAENAEAPVVHRLDRLEPWLDYAVELGASGLALGPIFASETHGYDTIDHFRIDPRLGDEEDFYRLVEVARGRGLKILLDGVFNHVGRRFGAFQAALAGGPEAPEAAWFRLFWPRYGGEPDYACFEGHRQLVTLNHDEPAVADYVVRVMSHWLDRGAAGWRLDAAYAMPRQFWADVLPRVRRAHPEAYVFGEVIHGDYAAFVEQTGVDAVTQYELWKAIWSAINDHNFFELSWALNRHNIFLEHFVPQSFVGNHDVTRIASQIEDERLLPHALVLLFTLGGTPSVYAGDEQAFRGIKENRAGGDDAVRPAFPAVPGELAPHGWPIFRLHQDLIGLRRRHPWLHRARTTIQHLTNRTMVYEAADAGQSLVVALNLTDETRLLPAPGARTVLAGEATTSDAGTTDAHVELPPFGWAVLDRA